MARTRKHRRRHLGSIRKDVAIGGVALVGLVGLYFLIKPSSTPGTIIVPPPAAAAPQTTTQSALAITQSLLAGAAKII